jgi:hypothetical protein
MPKQTKRSVKAIEEEEEEEIYQTQIAEIGIGDSQVVTLSGNYLRFQVDTVAQCNVVPLEL